MSDFENEFRRHDEPSNLGTGKRMTNAEEFAPVNGSEESKDNNDKEIKKNEKKDYHASAKAAHGLEEGHRNLEKQSLKTEHPTPEELLAMAYIADKPKNSDSGQAMNVDGVGVDRKLNT